MENILCVPEKNGLLTGYLMDVVGIHLGGTDKEKLLYPEYQKYKFETQKKMHQRDFKLAKTNFFKNRLPKKTRS